MAVATQQVRARWMMEAAAPDLLEACKRVLDAAEMYDADLIGEDHDPIYQDDWFTAGIVKRLRAAIAKAEGRESRP
jgi:hypothetical protein